MKKPEIENLKWLVFRNEITAYQKSLAVGEFDKLQEYVKYLESERQERIDALMEARKAILGEKDHKALSKIETALRNKDGTVIKLNNIDELAERILNKRDKKE